MVRGLEIFTEHFRDQTHSYLLIGGTACDLLFGEASCLTTTTTGSLWMGAGLWRVSPWLAPNVSSP